MTTGDAELASGGRDYAGAIYGSLLAGSVVAGTSPADSAPKPALLAILLLATGLVFWLAHVYAQLFGGAHPPDHLNWRTIRRVAQRERPIAEAVIPPAAAAMVGVLLGLSDTSTAWLALSVAVAGQVGWAMVAAVANGAKPWIIALSAVVNLALGLILVVLKALLSH
ncbi:MAG TPA: hypothetical protein VEX15_18955 [Nocardioidaceae bacterium]|nr:hypothetical protein [Nocardioidaceae bacterium]